MGNLTVVRTAKCGMREVCRSVSSSQQGEFWAQDELLSDEEPVGLPDAGADLEVEDVLPAPIRAITKCFWRKNDGAQC